MEDLMAGGIIGLCIIIALIARILFYSGGENQHKSPKRHYGFSRSHIRVHAKFTHNADKVLRDMRRHSRRPLTHPHFRTSYLHAEVEDLKDALSGDSSLEGYASVNVVHGDFGQFRRAMTAWRVIGSTDKLTGFPQNAIQKEDQSVDHIIEIQIWDCAWEKVIYCNADANPEDKREAFHKIKDVSSYITLYCTCTVCCTVYYDCKNIITVIRVPVYTCNFSRTSL